ncbi:hypothetical protein Klosneuvirus_4_80 [Klosneuvirus KNV1]|uniref:Uncharacterized protein n=1 Tax=Klosneuvirus KNV1 TaxID=1977640 RepID=A0A1V0SKJ5_9VIRU|nr:hypothetical protein Klosneuvirus_4_80 [Klosneuvirus KNV1]
MKFTCFTDIRDHILPILLYIGLWGAMDAFLNTFIPEDRYHIRAYVFLLVVVVSIFLLYETVDDEEDENKEKNKDHNNYHAYNHYNFPH